MEEFDKPANNYEYENTLYCNQEVYEKMPNFDTFGKYMGGKVNKPKEDSRSAPR